VSGADGYPTGPEWDGHILLLHGSESERQSGLTAWVRRGLELDERVIYSEPSDITADCSVRTVLAERGVDVTAATDEGRLMVLPPQEFYTSAGYDGLVEDALADGFCGARISAEDHTALTILSESELAHREHGLDQLCDVKPVSAMCQYARCRTSGGWLREIVAAHARVWQSGLRSDEHVRGTALTGEIDVANADIFAAALHAVTTSYDRMVWLDLGGLRFLDVAACRVLATVTQDFREGGGCVLLVAPQPSVERILRLLDVDRLEGVEVVGSEP
jgi:anti-anti-sigma factor